MKAGTIYYTLYGYYDVPVWVQPIFGFLISDLFLYAGLLCMILLSIMRRRDRIKSGKEAFVVGTREEAQPSFEAQR